MTSRPSAQRAGKLEEGVRLDNKNTLKKTKFDLRIVQSYLRRAREERPLLAIPVDELDAHLANFIRTHRKQDGSEYEAGTLRGILGSLDRHFEKSGYPHAIYRSRETRFLRTVSTMKEKQSYLKTLSKGSQPGPAEPLSDREIELLYASGAIGLHSPTALLHMLFFNMGLHFSLRTMEQHGLKWGDVTLKADAQGRKYLEHTKRLAPGRHPGRAHPAHTMTMQIYESPEQPERDVVRAYEKYTAERPEKMKCPDAPFYLTPQPDCRPGYARWFKNLPMGETRIRSIMKNLKMAAGLSPQRRIAGRCAVKSPGAKAGGAASHPMPPGKTPRGNQAMNGCRRKGHAVKKEEGDATCADDSEPQCRDPQSPPRVTTPNIKAIKEEWEPEDHPQTPRRSPPESRLFPGQGSVTFHDVAACFSSEEWSALEDWQKDLYSNVMREIHSALETMGYKIVNADVLLKVTDEDLGGKRAENNPQDTATSRSPRTSPDILLRVKQDELTDWRDLAVPEEEEEVDPDTSSSSLPVFDPDLSLWIFREGADMSPPEDAKDQAPTDTDDQAFVSHSDPSPYKVPLPEISTLYHPSYSEGSRPCKRKRRPPQRRSSEQVADSDSDEPKHRLPCRSSPAREGADWTRGELLFQCSLCQNTVRPDPGDALPSCSFCGGALVIHPLYSRPTCNETGAGGLPQTLHYGEMNLDAGFSHPMQGPVG